MNGDINKAMDTLSDMMSTEDGKKNLEEMIKSFTGGGQHQDSSGGILGGLKGGGLNMDVLMKVKGAIDHMQHGDDPRSNLLIALKPYLNSSRSGRLNETIKILSLAKLPDVIKSMKKSE